MLKPESRALWSFLCSKSHRGHVVLRSDFFRHPVSSSQASWSSNLACNLGDQKHYTGTNTTRSSPWPLVCFVTSLSDLLGLINEYGLWYTYLSSYRCHYNYNVSKSMMIDWSIDCISQSWDHIQLAQLGQPAQVAAFPRCYGQEAVPAAHHVAMLVFLKILVCQNHSFRMLRSWKWPTT